MHVKFRLPYLTALLLLAATPYAGAQSLPDPVAPAVIGRPLDQIGPGRQVRKKPAAVKTDRNRQVTASTKGPGAAPGRTQVAATHLAAPTTRPAAPAAAYPAAAMQQQPARAPDPRAVPRTQVVGAAGAPMRLAGVAPHPGAYFSSRDQALVQRYYESQPVNVGGPKWKVGETIPPKAALTGVPDDVRAALPLLPPGHQYVQLDGEVVLVAVQSRRVIDGVSRAMR